MHNPLISVMVPTYRRPQLLMRAVNSILKQTYQNFEIIVIDDNPDDETKTQMDALNDPRIRVIKSRRQGILGDHRNLAVENSKGEWIGFCDDDDYWHPEKLEKQVRVINKINPEKVKLICTNFWIRKKGQLKPVLNFWTRFKIFRNLYQTNFIGILTVLIKKEVFTNLGFFKADKKINGTEDFDMWIRVLSKYRYYYIPQCLAYYSDFSPTAGTQTMTDNKIEFNARKTHLIQSYLNNPLYPQQKIRKALSMLLIRDCIFKTLRMLTIDETYLSQSIKLNPFNLYALLFLFLYKINKNLPAIIIQALKRIS